MNVEGQVRIDRREVPQLLTIEEAAVLMRVTVAAIRVYNAAGRLPIVRVGKLRRIRVADLEKFIQPEGPSR